MKSVASPPAARVPMPFRQILIGALLATPLAAQDPQSSSELPPASEPPAASELPPPTGAEEDPLFGAADPLFAEGPLIDEEPEPRMPLEGLDPEEPDPDPAERLVLPEPRPSFYLALGYGVSDLGHSEGDLANDLGGASGITPDVDSVDDTDGGLKFLAGYWIHERIAIEVGFVDLGSVRSDFEFTGAPGSEAAIEQAIRDEHAVLGSGVTAGLRGIVLDGTDFDVTVKAGGFFWESETNVDAEFNGTSLDFVDKRSGTDFFYGAGLHYDLSTKWGLQLEYEIYHVEDETAGQLALSARYAFDL